jgi:O-antigen/teichoic acid export membrane protein
MSNDLRKNGKGTLGNSKRQFRSPKEDLFHSSRDDWDVPVTTTSSIDSNGADNENVATMEIPSVGKIVTNRLRAIERAQTVQLPAFDVPSLSLSTELRAIRLALPSIPQEVDGDWADAATWIMPAISKTGEVAHVSEAAKEQSKKKAGAGNYLSLALEMVKNSGLYAVGAMMSPLVSLILTPFLARNLSTSDYGALATLYIIVDLISTITQLGLSPAFFRAYNKDYETPQDRAGVLANTILLLAAVTIPAGIGMIFAAPILSRLFLKSAAYSGPVALTCVLIVAENLALPASSWFRAEKRPIPYTILSVVGTLSVLGVSVVLVGFLHLGVNGALVAKGMSFAVTIVYTYPLVLLRLARDKGLTLRFDIMKSMLTFGIPTVFGDISSWVLQVSDSWLLTLIGGGLAESGTYRAAYVLGGVLSPVLLAPWGLAWGPIMYSVSKRDDAPHVYKLVFRWWSTVLLFGAFGLSLLSIVVLDIFYPPSYRVGEAIIPLITMATMLQGIWYMFMIGVNLRRKTILEFVYMTFAAGSNLIFNLFLIPRYGEMGAAVATLLSYILLATISYIMNQRIYPIDFEIGSFILKLVIGVALYLVGSYLTHGREVLVNWFIVLPLLLLYGIILLLLGGLTPKKIIKLFGYVQNALGKGPQKANA